MKLFNLFTAKVDHEAIEKKQREAEKRLEEHARRLRMLEIEAGIYKPPLRRTGR